MKTINNKRILSGITPSGDGSLHIGNYLGAVRQYIEIAKQNDCFLFVADLHALTTVQNKTNWSKTCAKRSAGRRRDCSRRCGPPEGGPRGRGS